MSVRVIVDRDQCQANGMCVMVAPEVFEIGEDAIARLRVSEVALEDEADVREAIDLCPRNALELEQS